MKQNKTGNAILIVKDVEKLISTLERENKNITYTLRRDQSEKIKDRLNIVISNILISIYLLY